MRKTRILVLFLALLMLLSLVACKGKDDKPKYKSVPLDGWDSYSLVYPRNATADVTDTFVELTVELKNRYGTMLRPSDDFVMPGEEVPSDTLEILVGNTNREESKQIYDTLKANDYFIGMVNNRLLIIGGSDKATAEAIKHYSKYLLGEEGLLYPEEGYTYECEYKLDKLTIDGVDVSEFVIVRGNGMNADDRVMVTYLQKVIGDVCGAKIEVVIPSTEETAHEILIGNTTRAMTSDELKEGTYAIKQADGKLAMYGNGDYAASFVINKFIKETLMNIPKGKTYDIQMAEVSGEPFSPPTLVSTNLPSKLPDLTGLYNAEIKNVDTTFDRFLITRAELPEEVTVLNKITPDDYPTSKEKIEIYVSDKNGNDSNPGTKNAPLKTIQAAVNKVSGTFGGVIWVEGGNYSAADPILINASNSGNIIAPLFIIGYGDEPVTLSGGKKVEPSAFKPIDASDPVAARLKDSVKGNVYCANLYELGWTSSELITVTNKTQGVLTVNGERFTLARFPNEFNEDGSVLDSKDLLYVKHVYDRGSIANVDSNYYHEWVARVNKPGSGLSLSSVLGWEIQIVDERNPQVDRGDNALRDEILNWVNTGEIYAYGWMYAGWEIAGYRIDENCVHDGNKLGMLKPDGYYSLKSVQPCDLGACVSTNSAAGRNSYYLYNAIEALDAPGEWFLDKKTGMLYVYPKSSDIMNDEVTYMVKSTGEALIQLDKAKYVVIDNITINGANAKGISASDSKNIVIQDVNVTNTKSNGVEFIRCYDSAVTYSEFSYVGGLPVFVAFYDYPRQLQPMNIYIQNNYFHTPTPSNQYAINIRDGCRAVISHNLFVDTSVIMEGLEHIVEYNEFRGGSRDEIDAGMVYNVTIENAGQHVRYNLFHMFNACQRAIYNDSKSGGNYAYGNIISTRNANNANHLQPWYSSSGHGNVCYENIIICRDQREFAETSGKNPDTYTGLTDYVLESDLFYYYYGEDANGKEDPRNSGLASWLITGAERGKLEIAFYSELHDVNIMKTRYPESVNYLDTVKMILSAYEQGDYLPIYDVARLTGKKFTYMAEDGSKMFIPQFEYIDDTGKRRTSPERIIVAKNGNGYTLTHEELSAVERLWREGAMTVISKNLVLGASDNLDDVIRNNASKNKGFIEDMSYIEHNLAIQDAYKIMPDLDARDYTISEEGWTYLESEMGPSFSEALQKIDLSKIGIVK